MTCMELFTEYLLRGEAEEEKALLAAKQAIVDTIACMAAGLKEESVRIIGRYIEEKKNCDEEDLALLYGAAAHVLDYDCQNHCVDGHDSISITAVILSLAKEYPVSGKKALDIYAKAVNVDSWLGMGIDRENIRAGFNGSSLISVLGCAAAAGMMMGLDGKQMVNALSLSLLNAFGLTASFGYLSKDAVIGRTASTGIYCARMAKAGIDAPADIIEKANGYGSFYFTKLNVERIKKKMQEGPLPILFPGLSYKLYPVCFSVQTGYQNIRQLAAENSLKAQDVEKVAGILQYGMEGVRDNPVPEKSYAGKFDLRYCIALELLGKPVNMDTFAFGLERDEEAAELCRRIELIVDEEKKEFDETCFCGVKLLVCKNDGTVLTKKMEHPVGDNHLPMSDEEFRRKLEECCRRNLTLEQALKLEESLQKFSELTSVDIINILVEPIWKEAE